ncbi:hypothetical protein PHYBLDRAFT_146928 [Phycomyces blakesleeanus NRRL 1555(-)]|uniref:Uncharacterized protein n=1 Tax=Phycomyces blakesleeanus (strain ATCC 8743b / DSM 1359 / FGSC 10004 / NBRC 33097 / NRRL 1555) TaxID=763407 RepID=A0A162X189_PHYB8|nr:hypothetical protein PHYBLDRAFT_146928 [Phycomyces blakesleeanus NRRL 1555(-)]OAD71945.1 hypothetical protein PHYBLDRAFT_146928 [Phycomyces blakesleeanus NRRL 1555(-)]|eukprot:XP_018289985.1 hypothetical protein PHYBLDRAFT_146928 [Phycomyces blakesleeanus NRRL 1555(-)]
MVFNDFPNGELNPGHDETDIVKETSEVVSHNEIHFEDKKLNDSVEKVEMPAQIRDLFLSKSDAVFGVESNEYAVSNDLDNKEDESDADMSDDEESRIAKKTYVYNSIVSSLKIFFHCPKFENSIDSWNYGPKPFDEVIHSCGAIYLAINNLLHNIRFKKENVILVGLMPGPKEPSMSDINNYLKPLVNELTELYTALLMVACEIPAARKVCGFTSHTSTNACHKCTAKRMIERWVADGIIDNKKLVAMQKAVEKIVLPPDYTSLGTKIAKGFPYMKANE